MSADIVSRTVGVLACATTLTLFSTIFAYAAVNVAPLKWDGSFCSAQDCRGTVALFDRTGQKPSKIARLSTPS